MSKARTRTLYLLSIGFAILGFILFFVGLPSATSSSNLYSGGTVTNFTITPLLVVAFVLFAIASILSLVAWIGALIKTAQLGRWGWFVCLLLFSGITMLIYIFAGPETPAMAVPPPGSRPY